MILSQTRSSRFLTLSTRLCSLVRAASVPAVLALTVTATGLAADNVAERAATHAIPGTQTVTAIHRLLQVGKASWYGLRFQGRKTATGETFDMNELTCAHPSLPLGSWLRVTNLRNHRSVVVRVNDRGPFLRNRIVDLSYAAARAVGLEGVAQVKLESAADPAFDGSRPLIAGLRMPPSLLNLSLLMTPAPAH